MECGRTRRRAARGLTFFPKKHTAYFAKINSKDEKKQKKQPARLKTDPVDAKFLA